MGPATEPTGRPERLDFSHSAGFCGGHPWVSDPDSLGSVKGQIFIGNGASAPRADLDPMPALTGAHWVFPFFFFLF